MNYNLIYCQCKDWQDFMNSLIIPLGQPVIKADKHAQLLSIEDRSQLVTYAQPKVKGFAKSKNRLYLPLGIEQLAVFLQEKLNKQIKVDWLKSKVKFKVGTYEVEGKTWFEAGAMLLRDLKKKGEIA